MLVKNSLVFSFVNKLFLYGLSQHNTKKKLTITTNIHNEPMNKKQANYIAIIKESKS